MNSATLAPSAAPTASPAVSPWIWPGLLIAGPAAVVIACVITAYFVLQHPDGLVASDYYKQGKAINAQLSQLDRAQQLGMDRMTIVATGRAVTLSFPTGRETGSIEVILAHPVDPGRDIRQVVAPEAPGRYVMPLAAPLGERRRVIVTDAPAHSWRSEALYIPGRG